MPTYGNYETVGRIYSIGARSVYSAKAVGGSRDEFVIKIVSADDVFGEDPADVLRDFTQRAKIQQKLGEVKASAWTVVHEVGQRDTEVYYVTDRAASSAQQLVAGKVRAEEADLYRVVSAVIQGLRELRAAANRAHANLKPSNVLIDRTGDVASATVLLTDPSGAEQSKPAVAEHADVQDLGDLIHQMVLHAPFRAMGGYPIEDSPNWVRLGKSGQQWRALCNRMLDPAAVPGALTIESLAGEIDSLKARASGGGGKKGLIIGAAAALLVVAGIVAVVVMKKPKDGPVAVQYDARAWTRWAIDARWAMDFRDSLRPGSGRRGKLEADEYLRTALLPRADENVDLDPRNAMAANNRRRPLGELTQSPPPEASSPEAVTATNAANAWIARVEDAISPEGWPAHRSMLDAEARLKELGLQRVPDFPNRLLKGLRDRTNGERLLESILDVAQNAGVVDRLLASLKGVQPEYRDEINIWIINETSILDGANASHLEELAAYLGANAEQFRVERVASNSGNQGTGVPGTGSNPTPVVVVPDLEPVENIGPDPRVGWTAAAQLEAVRARLGEGWVGELDGTSATGAAQAAADVDAAARILATVASLEWTVATRDRVREEMARAESRLALTAGAAERLSQDFEAQRASERQSEEEAAEQAQSDFDDFVDQFRARTPEGLQSEYLLRQWDHRRDLILRDRDEPSDLRELRNDASRLEREVTTAETEIPMPAVPESGPEGYDPGALLEYFTGQREAAIERAWDAGVAVAFEAGFDAAVQAQRAELAGVADVARRAVADMARADAGLKLVAGWEEPLNQNNPPDTLAGLHARWGALGAPPELAAAVGPTPVTLAAVGRLNGSLAGAAGASPEDLSNHVDQVADANEPLISRLYRWRALRAHPGVTLPEEREMLAGLRAAITALPAARQATLAAELTLAAADRWTAVMENAVSEAEYVDAREARAEFGGNLGVVSARTRFNLGLIGVASRLRQLGPSASDDQVREVLGPFMAMADGDRGTWENDSSVNAWIGSVRAAMNRPSGTNLDGLAKRGPGAAGWAFEAMDPGGNRVRYTRSVGSDNLSLELVRLDPGPDGVERSVYLSTTEVSVRLLGAAITGENQWPAMAAAWKGRLTNTEDSWDGPKVWAYAESQANRLVRNTKWIADEGTGAMEIRNPFAAAAEARSLDMPVQHITAPAARLFATLNGCRLPTSVEWRAARNREVVGGWNLRDLAWEAQRKFAEASQSTSKPIPFPDRGAFTPEGRPLAIEAAATWVTSATDGVLYFQGVDTGAGSVFRHIVGNVAEFVDDSPAGYDGSEERRWFRVVGGSSLSAPEIPIEEAFPLVLNEADSWMVLENTYPDVGFRLAFDAGQLGGGPPLAQQVGELVDRLVLVARLAP